MNFKIAVAMLCLMLVANRVWAQGPELIVQAGHLSQVNSLQFSPDGKTLVSCGGAYDHIIKLWDVSTGKLLRNFLGHKKTIKRVTFSPDGRVIASSSWDCSIRLWNAASGELLDTLYPNYLDDEWMLDVKFSPDGKMLACSDGNGTVHLYGYPYTERIIRKWVAHASSTEEESDHVEAIWFSPDSKMLVTNTGETAKLWDVASGKLLSTINSCTSSQFSFDGKYFVTGSPDGMIEIWNSNATKIIRTIKAHPAGAISCGLSRDGKVIFSCGEEDNWIVKLWDTATGRIIQEFKAFDKDWGVCSLTMNTDSNTLAIGYVGPIVLWDVTTRTQIKNISEYTNTISSLKVSKDANSIVITRSKDPFSGQVAADLIDVRAGNLIRKLKHQDEIELVTISDDSRLIATSSDDRTVKLWDTRNGFLLHTLQGHNGTVTSAAFSPDADIIATLSGDGARIWNPLSGKLLRVLKNDQGTTQAAVIFSPDGKILATSTDQNTVILRNSSSGAIQRTLQGPSVAKDSKTISSILFSPSGKFLAGVRSDHAILLWDTISGKYLHSFQGPTSIIEEVEFSPDEKFIASCSWDDPVFLWEVSTGKKTHSFDIRLPNKVRFSPGSRSIVAGTLGGEIVLWDIMDGSSLFSERNAHLSYVYSLDFVGPAKILLSASQDGAMKLWDLDNNEQLAEFYTFNQSDWVAVTPEGRFDTDNLDEIKGLHWVMPDDPFTPVPIEAFMRHYYEPRLLPRILAGEKFKELPALTELNRVQPKVIVHEPEVVPGKPDEVTIKVEVARGEGEYLQGGNKITKTSGEGKDRKTIGIHDIKLFRDGQLVGFADDELIKKHFDEKTGRATLTFSNIKLPRTGVEEVEFSAYAFNVDMVKSETNRRKYSLPALAPHKGRAYLITFGVNASQNPNLPLGFAVNDAELMAKLLEEKLRARNAVTKEYSDVVPIVLRADDKEKSATKANIQAVLDLLAGKSVDDALLQQLKAQIPAIDKIGKATPEDLILFSFSCHGDLDKNGVFHLLPYDVDQSTPPPGAAWQKSISSEDLSLWLREVDAGEMVMIVDACHSAGTVGDEFKPGPMGSRGLGQLAYDKGMRILAASQADNVALESSRIGHGLLTYALLKEGIEAGKADYKPVADQKILLDEWLGYGVERVPSLAEEVKSGTFKDARATTVIHAPGSTGNKQAPPAQIPSLFDFQKNRRDVVLDLVTR